jgi:hypothetical protein
MARSAGRVWDRLPRHRHRRRGARRAILQKRARVHTDPDPGTRGEYRPRHFGHAESAAEGLSSESSTTAGRTEHGLRPTIEVTLSPPLVGDREDPTEGKHCAERLSWIGPQQRIAMCRFEFGSLFLMAEQLQHRQQGGGPVNPPPWG